MTFTTDRRSLLLGASALGATTLLGLSGQPLRAATPSQGGTLRLGIGSFDSGETLDPQASETKFMQNLQWQLRNNLIEVGAGGVLMPELATSWDSNDDLTVWTFQLREGVQFHNGKTMDADDVVFSINLHRGEASYSQVKSLVSVISDVQATGPNEVTITLASGNAGFPAVLSLTCMYIVPADDTNFDAGIGTGPYMLETYEPGVKSVVRKNPNYWKTDKGHFDSVEMFAIRDVNARTTALQTGEIDAMNAVDPSTANLLGLMPGIDLIQTQGKVHYAFSMMVTDPLFSDNRVRTAMKLSVNRQDMVDKVLNGYGSIANDQPISNAYAYYDPDLVQHEYDPDQAKSLLKAAGAEGLTATLHASNTPFTGAVDAAQLFSEHATASGININVSREPEDGYWSNIWGKKAFFASRWSGRANEDLMLSLAYSKESIGDYNETSWDNPAFNAVLVAARSEKDDAKRRALYNECQMIIAQEGGMIAPVWADFLDAKSSKLSTPEAISGDWDLDGNRCAERWWFNA
ncbi:MULTISPECIES: ABC transporter substrate-binding protein [Pacificibacter]|uniref:ABC transporter substrate-binding protein n=1 Tax=Pacificibacter TaxID=1042323 RepID=UPI001C089117|nr:MULTISPECIES: ABC transporter substrate-binding protein [Pacificibacter]MBU2936395.1 ABC transporter substrate-binding protein [Pacificibacter marinus]MDO6616564.1 ABC transporter substrate-binding protein [Pacificibacter sp. 1_MG-2023]